MNERTMAEAARSDERLSRPETGWPGPGLARDAEAADALAAAPAGRTVAPLAEAVLASDEPWQAAFGLETGTTVLPGGRVREIDVAGERLDIFELDAKGRTAIQHGRIEADAVAMETARHDADGRPLTRLATELHAVEGFSQAMSAAALHRDGQWFEDGLAVRDLREGLRLFVVRAEGLGPEAGAGLPLGDSLHARHCASIREFRAEEEVLAATVDQAWDLALGPAGDGEAMEAGPGHRFSLTITNQDALGRPARSLRLTDARDAAGERSLGLAVTWYRAGLVARVVEGSWAAPDPATPSPVEAAWRLALPGGPVLRAVLGGTGDAGTVLSGIFLEAARNMGALVGPARRALAERARDLSGLVGSFPHAVSWTREEYAEGVLVGRRRDVGQARRAGPQEGGPALLRAAGHVDERFYAGRPVSRHGLDLEELAGDDGLVTSCRATAGAGDQPRLATRVSPGPLAEADPEAGRAGETMIREVGVALAEALRLLARLGERSDTN